MGVAEPNWITAAREHLQERDVALNFSRTPYPHIRELLDDTLSREHVSAAQNTISVWETPYGLHYVELPGNSLPAIHTLHDTYHPTFISVYTSSPIRETTALDLMENEDPTHRVTLEDGHWPHMYQITLGRDRI